MYQMYRTLFDGIASSDRMRENNFQNVYIHVHSLSLLHITEKNDDKCNNAECVPSQHPFAFVSFHQWICSDLVLLFKGRRIVIVILTECIPYLSMYWKAFALFSFIACDLYAIKDSKSISYTNCYIQEYWGIYSEPEIIKWLCTLS